MKFESMKLEALIVTPEMAAAWMALNLGNRRIRPSIVAQYARDMAEGHWEPKPVAICFDQEGHLGNGQHTLSAIIKSERPQHLLIARNVPRRAIGLMDMGLKRTISYVARFIGEEINSRAAGVTRIVAWGPWDLNPRGFDELFHAYGENKDVIDFVTSFPKKAGITASVLGVCAIAAKSWDRGKISRFLEVLDHGLQSGDHESAAVRLRDYVRSLRAATSIAIRIEIYNKTTSALYSFLKGQPMSKIYGTEKALFPGGPSRDRGATGVVATS